MNMHAVLQPSYAIGEPSFADAIKAIELANGLEGKRYWATSLRQLAGYLGLPCETIPARISAISSLVAKLHPERLGVNGKTFSNHRANAKAALRWFNRQTLGSARNAPMECQLREIWNQIGDRFAKDMLSPFFRYLTATGVELSSVSDADIASYVDHRQKTNFKALRSSQVRQLVRYWNACRDHVSGWPDIVLTEPVRALSHDGPAFEDFPEGLRLDIGRSCSRLAKPHKAADGRLMKACAASTINHHRRVLIAAIRKAVSIGFALAELQSLKELLKPKRAEAILEAYWKKDGKTPSTYTIDLAVRFVTIARAEGGVDPEALARLDDMRRALETHRTHGLTYKNRAVVRQVLMGGLWSKVVQLPSRLIAQADADRRSAPLTSATKAQMAVAIRILSVAPIRIKNLAEIEIGTHLIRPRGPGTAYGLTFERYDVKNDIPLEFELDETTSDLIDRYIMNHRPALMRGRNHNSLFPGMARTNKASDTFGLQITKTILNWLGIKLTPHQFRHAAAALLLDRHPGHYELVRQVLGHKNIATTMSFYVGLETLGATRMFGAMVTEMDGSPQETVGISARKRHRRG